jgi:hypothetical protein
VQSGVAEIRHSRFRSPLPSPYRQVINGSHYADASKRIGNLHVIRLDGVAPEAVKPCIECWCLGTAPPIGGVGCCADCPTTSEAPPQRYFLQLNVTYQVLDTPQAAAAVTPAMVAWLNVANAVEHDITPTAGPPPHPLARASHTYALDFFCPQRRPFTIVTCLGHQHIGGACVRLIDDATGAVICESCPVYGAGAPGEPGDEPGFLVDMTATDLAPPYQVAPDQIVRVESDYYTDRPYAGVMSIIILVLGGFQAPRGQAHACQLDNLGLIQVGGGSGRLRGRRGPCSAVQCSQHGAWCMVHGAWCMVHGA